MRETVLLGLDWGTSSVRAYAFDSRGDVLAAVSDTTDQAMGVQTLKLRLGRDPKPEDFADALQSFMHALNERLNIPSPLGSKNELPILACGMIGSKQGLKDAGYASCPTNPATLGKLLVQAPCGPYLLHLVPGLCTPKNAHKLPDFMRGEETQVLGAMQGANTDGFFVLPGSHSKWVDVREGTITMFDTHFSGELFAVLKEHSILGRLFEPTLSLQNGLQTLYPPSLASRSAEQSAEQNQAFERGIQTAKQNPQNLLQHLFSTRALGLDAQLSAGAGEHFLSGLLIGHEVSAAMASRNLVGSIKLVGGTSLCARYAQAFALFNIATESYASTSALGLWRLGRAAKLF
jgi:2-dehydro-3-deoxygalactonokinase